MSVETVATPEAVVVPAPEPVTLAEHQQEFPAPVRHQPPPVPDDDVERPVPEKRHRAQSQRAAPEDAAAIAALTKRLREAEEAVGIAKQPGESDRVYQLRRRAEVAELAKTQRAPAPQAPAPLPPPPARQPAAATFTEAEPTLEQFASSTDPYSAHQRALAAYDRRKEAFEGRQAWEQTQATHEATQRQAATQKWVEERRMEHDQRVSAFVAERPDVKALFESPAVANLSMTPVMFAAIQLHAQGPQFMHALATAPDLAEDLFFLTEGKDIGNPLTNPLVAIVQRRLLQRAQAVQTGSAAPSVPETRAPRPPNPVRTGPIRPSDDPPGEGSSLAAHRKFYPPPRRR